MEVTNPPLTKMVISRGQRQLRAQRSSVLTQFESNC